MTILVDSTNEANRRIEEALASEARKLNLTGLGLAMLPAAIGALESLTSLYLSFNRLASLPREITNLTNLEELELIDNRFERVPDEVRAMPRLKTLALIGNRGIRRLPFFLGDFRNLVYISIPGTGITNNERNSLLELCQTNRSDNCAEELPERLDFWIRNAKRDYNFAFICELDRAKQAVINEWLLRLGVTKEFQNNEEELARTCCEILETLASSSDFSDCFFNQARSNNSRCGDRAAMALNEIYTSWRLFTMPQDASREAKLSLLCGVSKTLTLRNILTQKIRHRIERESVEIYLYYEIQLREMNLVTAVASMHFPRFGRRDWIDVEELKQSVENDYTVELLQLPAFDKFLESEPSLKSEIDAIKTETLEAIEQVRQEESNDWNSLFAINELERAKNERIKRLIEAQL